MGKTLDLRFYLEEYIASEVSQLTFFNLGKRKKSEKKAKFFSFPDLTWPLLPASSPKLAVQSKCWALSIRTSPGFAAPSQEIPTCSKHFGQVRDSPVQKN